MNTNRTRKTEGRILIALLLVLPLWGVIGPGGAREIVRDLLGRQAEVKTIDASGFAD